MQIRRIILSSTILSITLLLLTGCWDQQGIEKRAYVMVMGIDKAKDPGKILVTYLIANPEVGSQAQGGSTDEPAQEIISIETNDLAMPKTLANAVIAKEITYDLLRVIIVSEDLASDQDFIRWMYDATKD